MGRLGVRFRAGCGAAALALFLAAPALAQDLTGTYRVAGSNPGGQGSYEGEAAVVATGDTFQIVWRIGGQEHRGTGVVFGDTLSVVYQPGGGRAGVAVYEITSDGALAGAWTTLGGEALGEERWEPEGGL